MKNLISLILVCFIYTNLLAQKSSKVKLSNPLIIGNIPRKALSLQYEHQTSSNNNHKTFTSIPTATGSNSITSVPNFRLSYYKPVIIKPKLYVSIDAGYWYSKFNFKNNGAGVPIFNDFDATAFHSANVSTTIFKPINATKFLYLAASVEINGNNKAFNKFGVKNFVASGFAIYGWKKGFKTMTGIGLFRAYRLGRVIYAPALLWNSSFNKKWGVEMLLPSRATFRYNFKKTNFITTGFDLEGTQYAYYSNLPQINKSFLQRGEIKPRIGLDVQTAKNLRFTANAGCRINARLDIADNYDGKRLIVENNPKINAFINIGFHIVNLKPNKTKK